MAALIISLIVTAIWIPGIYYARKYSQEGRDDDWYDYDPYDDNHYI